MEKVLNIVVEKQQNNNKFRLKKVETIIWLRHIIL